MKSFFKKSSLKDDFIFDQTRLSAKCAHTKMHVYRVYLGPSHFFSVQVTNLVVANTTVIPLFIYRIINPYE